MSPESDLSKHNFLARMSHEMRTPLNAIIGMCSLAQAADHPEKISNCLAKISDASIHLLGMINSVLDLARLESGELELSSAEIDLARMLRQVVRTAKFSLAAKEQNLRLEFDPALPEIILADEQRLSQVMENFLSNAVKFTPPGGTITMTVKKLRDEGNTCALEIGVRDTGIGISGQELNAAFSLFEQTDGGLSRKYGGAGIGLPVSARIVKLMGGEIRVKSEPGKGSRFSFEITVEQRSKKEAGGNSARSGTSRFAGKTILLAEDVEINRDIVVALLEDTGIAIDCAENGEEALIKYMNSPGKYGLILMDIHMPEMDGLEATRRIRAFEKETRDCRGLTPGGNFSAGNFPAGNPPAQIPVIAMTANVFSDDVTQCLAAGMTSHIGKPLNHEELIKQLDSYLL